MNIKSEVRTAIMKYVGKNPGSPARDIIGALCLSKSNGAKMLMRMAVNGDLSRKEVTVNGIDSAGKQYSNQSFVYTLGTPVKTAPNGIVEKPGFYSQGGGGWRAGKTRAEDRGQGSAGIRVSAGMFGLGGW